MPKVSFHEEMSLAIKKVSNKFLIVENGLCLKKGSERYTMSCSPFVFTEENAQ